MAGKLAATNSDSESTLARARELQHLGGEK